MCTATFCCCPIEVFGDSELLLVEKAVHDCGRVDPRHCHLWEGSHHRPSFAQGVRQDANSYLLPHVI